MPATVGSGQVCILVSALPGLVARPADTPRSWGGIGVWKIAFDFSRRLLRAAEAFISCSRAIIDFRDLVLNGLYRDAVLLVHVKSNLRQVRITSLLIFIGKL